MRDPSFPTVDVKNKYRFILDIYIYIYTAITSLDISEKFIETE